ncbi:MAG: hypothetical protein JWQ43_2853 [Glaciihabitans sp.]|nr:hypothetical protein [Glaciihabitans sp.]
MQWWNEFLSWFNSVQGQRVLTTAIVPFIAIVVAGVVAALIGRGVSKRVLAHQDRELKAAAVMALIGAGRKATVWSSLGGDEKQRVDNQLSEADIRIRLLPIAGTNAAADWAAHELAGMKKNSANFSFQAEQTFVEYRNRLLEWQNKPKRARKLFAFDLEQWRFDDEATEKALTEKQVQWDAQQAKDKDASATAPATPAYARPMAAQPTAAVIAPAAVTPAASAEAEVPSNVPPTGALTSEYLATVGRTPTTGSTAVIPPVDTSQEVVAPQSTTEQPPADRPQAETTSDEITPTTDVVGDEDDQPDERSSNSVEDDGSYSPPVTAGTVRRRTDPDAGLDTSTDY